jgi:hypothetical protein
MKITVRAAKAASPPVGSEFENKKLLGVTRSEIAVNITPKTRKLQIGTR